MTCLSKAGLYRIACLCVLLSGSSASSQYTYVEGTDTTDVAGKGMNGLFAICSHSIDGAAVVYGASGPGYLNCTFDELQKVPDSIRSSGNFIDNVSAHCFIVCSPSDSTWAKVQVTRQLPDKRFVYRYGKNRTSRNKLLVTPNYDRQRIYRPNNAWWSELYGRYVGGIYEYIQEVTLIWEPPLPCNKQVTGYVVYGNSQTIDTAKPINPKEWERTGTTSENVVKFKAGPRYISIVAVYPGDTTGFPGVLTRMDYAIGIMPHQPQSGGNGAYPSTINSFVPLTAPASLCTFDGRRVSKGDFSGGRYANLAAGVYIRFANASEGGESYKTMAIGR